MQNCQVFIVSFKRDFRYLEYCLKSLAKYAHGFMPPKLLVPCQDFEDARELVNRHHPEVSISCGFEWPGKGFNWHQLQVMHAEHYCPNARFIVHLDSDCVFTESVRVEDFFRESKPVLHYESYESLIDIRKHTEYQPWLDACRACLPFGIYWETMRAFPIIHHRDLYPLARSYVEQKVRVPIDLYFKEAKNEYPQSVAELNTLGSVAMTAMRDQYHLKDMAGEPWPYPKLHPWDKLHQSWSHRPPTDEDIAVYRKAGLL